MLITKPTVLILGAGASMPYNFPSGADLLRRIQQYVAQGDEFARFMHNIGYDGAEVTEFSNAVRRCGRSSIDAFLEGRADLVNVGKAAIATMLIPFENEPALYQHAPTEDHWYQYLFTRLSDRSDAERFREHRLTIVTYNYDRSIEYYLFHALKASYGLTDEAAADLLATIPIIHVHGCLGSLLWQKDGFSREYVTELSPDAVKNCALRIQIISEKDLEGGNAYQRAREALAEAELACFLGFGYYEMNLARLHVERWKDGIAIWGTAYRMTRIEHAAANHLLRNSLNPDGDADHRIIEFLRNKGPFV